MKNNTKIKIKQISKEILIYLFIAGAICIAASSPRFVSQLTKSIFKYKLYQKRKFLNSFSYLRRNGMIRVKKKDNRNIRVTLTDKGRKRAEKYWVRDLEIKRPEKWDKKWRVVIFDIPHEQRVARNIVRKKLKELNFCPLQKSVWVHPFECRGEIKALRNFLRLQPKEMQVILAENIENDSSLRKFFEL